MRFCGVWPNMRRLIEAKAPDTPSVLFLEAVLGPAVEPFVQIDKFSDDPAQYAMSGADQISVSCNARPRCAHRVHDQITHGVVQP